MTCGRISHRDVSVFWGVIETNTSFWCIPYCMRYICYYIHYCSHLVHGNCGSWLSWSNCSKICGPGTKARKREYTNPMPLHGGKQCPGYSISNAACNGRACRGKSFSIVLCLTSPRSSEFHPTRISNFFFSVSNLSLTSQAIYPKNCSYLKKLLFFFAFKPSPGGYLRWRCGCEN